MRKALHEIQQRGMHSTGEVLRHYTDDDEQGKHCESANVNEKWFLTLPERVVVGKQEPNKRMHKGGDECTSILSHI
jgi:hypothetical protein